MQGLQRGSGGDQLEGGAGGIGAGQEPVQVSAVVVAVAGRHLGHFRVVRRVKGGSGEHTEHLTGLVVIQSHHPFPACHGLVGGVVQVGVQGQFNGVAGAGGASDEAEAHQLVSEQVFRPRVDVPLLVADGVEGGDAGGLVVAVVALGAVKEHRAVPIQDRAGGDTAVGVHVLVAIEGRPLSTVLHVKGAQRHRPGGQGQDEQEHKEGASLELFHSSSSSHLK